MQLFIFVGDPFLTECIQLWIVAQFTVIIYLYFQVHWALLVIQEEREKEEIREEKVSY